MEEVLIVGQGLAGTWLSWWLYQNGIQFKIIDQLNRESASMRAAGLINPVTGRRMVTTWMIEELLPFANDSYQEIGGFLGRSFIEQISVVDLFPSVQMLQAFQKRFEEDPSFLYPGEDREKYSEWFRYDLGWGSVKPCMLVNTGDLLTDWRESLKKAGLLIEDDFVLSKLNLLQKGIKYSDTQYSYIIFCDGKSSSQNPYFDKLPFALNKGEGMLVEIKGLPGNTVFKKGMTLIPYRENIYWLGSSYEWDFDNDQPSKNFRKTAESWLNNYLKSGYYILEHFASIRPATLERRPFVGFHPLYPQVGILNGMGTKGCSLAPYFAKQLVNKLAGEGNIHPLADINRFEKVMRRI
jgi:glycine/D-amino acid oxidase-like deaminating enzyme